jgi:uncharacterized protein YqgV (UPF0045/DUF77 family)
MQIGVEISLYPLSADFVPPIANFIERLEAEPRLKVVPNSMSTQVFGDFELVFDVLRRECRNTFEREPRAVFVMKVLGPLRDA